MITIDLRELKKQDGDDGHIYKKFKKYLHAVHGNDFPEHTPINISVIFDIESEPSRRANAISDFFWLFRCSHQDTYKIATDLALAFAKKALLVFNDPEYFSPYKLKEQALEAINASEKGRVVQLQKLPRAISLDESKYYNAIAAANRCYKAHQVINMNPKLLHKTYGNISYGAAAAVVARLVAFQSSQTGRDYGACGDILDWQIQVIKNTMDQQ